LAAKGAGGEPRAGRLSPELRQPPQRAMSEESPPRFGATWVGLCLECVHAQRVETRASVFWRCRLSDQDPRFDKYPRLPVLECSGYRRAASEGDTP
jgi:hypothetical protein